MALVHYVLNNESTTWGLNIVKMVSIFILIPFERIQSPYDKSLRMFYLDLAFMANEAINGSLFPEKRLKEVNFHQHRNTVKHGHLAFALIKIYFAWA